MVYAINLLPIEIDAENFLVEEEGISGRRDLEWLLLMVWIK